jgi:hypothetical protein
MGLIATASTEMGWNFVGSSSAQILLCRRSYL